VYVQILFTLAIRRIAHVMMVVGVGTPIRDRRPLNRVRP
jgi:hypothetical protein